MSEYPFSVTVRKYESFADISKGKLAKINEKKIEFSQNSPARWGYFTKLFCHYQQFDGAGAPINLNLSDLKVALNNVEISENGYLDTNKLFKKNWLDKNDNAKRYGSSCKSVLKEYMPLLLMPENPNKFLKMALDCRKKGNFEKPDNAEPGFKDPLNSFCIGLDRIAQFLNFCVMLRQIPTKKGQEIKNIDQIEKLSFDKSVLKEFVDQYKQEVSSVEKLIGANDMEKYQTQLKDLHAKYDNYCRAMINKENGSYGGYALFHEWISRKSDFVEGVVRAYDNGFTIGVYESDPNKIIDREGVKEEQIKYGYHYGGGITDNIELTKLLKLDAVLQAEKAINKFIDTKALDSIPILEWLRNLWNSLYLVKKLGLVSEKKMKLQENKFIPRLDQFEDDKKEQKIHEGLR